MWLCLKEGFLSIVDKDVAEGQLLVRSRVKEHITRYWPDADVKRTPGTHRDYLYRASISRDDVAKVIADYVMNDISEGNFKASVTDRKLHRVLMRAWGVFAELQEIPPYSDG
jgi:hypothetical protein